MLKISLLLWFLCGVLIVKCIDFIKDREFSTLKCRLWVRHFSEHEGSKDRWITDLDYAM